MESLQDNPDLINQLFQWAQAHPSFQYAVAAYFILKGLTTVLPSEWRGYNWYNTAYNWAMKFVNVYAWNVGKAKNADDKWSIF